MNRSLDLDEHGLPLRRARFAFTKCELWSLELRATQRRFSQTWPEWPLGDCWRLETFVPQARDSECWGAWASQAASPFYKAEAEMQNAFCQTSLALGRRLLSGEIVGFGRDQNLAGNWTAIPAAAWHLLRVPVSTSRGGSLPFQNWELGHVVGAGFDLWDVRLRDTVGIPPGVARLAYGPPDASNLFLRTLADPEFIKDEGAPRGDLDRRMRELGDPLTSHCSRGEYDAAVQSLKDSLCELLSSKILIQVGAEPNALILQTQDGALYSANGPEIPTRKAATAARKAGNSFVDSDAPLIDEMKKIAGDEKCSPWSAARKVVSRARGLGDDESKVKRLAQGYNRKYPPEDQSAQGKKTTQRLSALSETEWDKTV